jgi:pyruvate dehydrogenase (quinone)
MIGLMGIKVDKPGDIAEAWDEALRLDQPAVVEFVVDPEVPPLPPHISFEQAVAFWKSIYKGDVHKWRMIKQSFKDVVEDYLPKGRREASPRPERRPARDGKPKRAPRRA